MLQTRPTSAASLSFDASRTAMAVFIAGLLLLLVPPMIEVAKLNWSTEQGGHGPIVIATGLWLLHREWTKVKDKRQPGNPWIGFVALAILLPAYVVAGITGILELQVAFMYAAVVAAAYLIVGSRVLRYCWFPILYLAFAVPPPDTVIAVLTQPIKLAISEWAVAALYALGYPIGSSGVMIQIAQYELLVAAACSGLNSLLTLSAICLFYVYLRHSHDWKAFLIIGLVVFPIAVLANFIRVLILILLTYHAGEATAQGFLHDFAGIVTFAAALAITLLVEAIYSRVQGRG